MTQVNTIGKKVMRRVYYAYALRLATHPVTLHAFVLVLSVFALSRLTHVAAIINNIMGVKVGDLGGYIFNTLVNAEFLTLVCVGVIFFTLLSLPLRLSLPRTRRIQTI